MKKSLCFLSLALLVWIACLATAACQQSSAQKLIGKWNMEGYSDYWIEFRPDRTVYSGGKNQPTTSMGTFSVEGNTLTHKDVDGTETIEISFDGDRLIMTGSNGERACYQRCPE